MLPAAPPAATAGVWGPVAATVGLWHLLGSDGTCLAQSHLSAAQTQLHLGPGLGPPYQPLSSLLLSSLLLLMLLMLLLLLLLMGLVLWLQLLVLGLLLVPMRVLVLVSLVSRACLQGSCC